ncbi:MAG TPA: ferritin-like domain-containing protein [Streptosporangiaceae bacterium]|nr:ferritin-like domain-containing protein [Streptosporangiaceae bacterium]
MRAQMISPAPTQPANDGLFEDWVLDFEAERERRLAAGDPDWSGGAVLDASVARSLQRFQLGESGDGANLAAKADRAGDESYAAAVRLFIAEEQNHARLLAELLAAAGVRLISSHWSDLVFVRLRRALGLRLELMVLFVAEFIALFYYRACRDGAGDQLASDVAGQILADEERHVRFHTKQLQLSFARLPAVIRRPVCWAWLLLMVGTAGAVVFDHGAALTRYGVRRTAFTRQVLRAFAATVARIRRADPAAPA